MSSIVNALRALVLSLPSLVLCASILSLLLFAFRGTEDLWSHIYEFVLWRALWNTLVTSFLAIFFASLVGVILAWLVVFVDFPGRRFFSAVLALPLAFPAYVFAFIAIGSLDYSSQLMTWLRESWAVDGHALFQIRSRLGMSLVLAASFYPYVYLLAREAFRSQGASLFEASRSLGCRPFAGVWRLSLPLARPWILSGVALVLMESMADFGVASAFNIETLTVAVYRVWFSMFSLPHAAQLALIHLGIVLLFLGLLRKLTREHLRYEDRGAGAEAPWEFQISRPWTWLISTGVTCFWFVVFVLPVLQLILWSLPSIQGGLDARFLGWVRNAILMSAATAILVCFFAFLITYLQRIYRLKALFSFARFATVAYAFPGSVLALSLSLVLIFIFGSTGAMGQWVLLAMWMALGLRFFAVGFQPIYQGFRRLSMNLDEASQSLGVSGFRLFLRLHFPLIRPSVLAAFLFVMMDCLKEMPIHVMMRPFGWDTLAVRIFEFTREGEWERAALPALVIVMISFPIVLWLSLKLSGIRKAEDSR